MSIEALYKSLDDLPGSLPIFPLPGAVLLPGGDIPLNIFEPRYLQMLSDALAGDRLIGMIQPRNIDSEHDEALFAASGTPELYDIGCAGRITSFTESEDGQVQIILSGICRFRFERELETEKPYRMVKPAFSDFEVDLHIKEIPAPDTCRKQLLDSLDRFLEARSMQADWEEINSASTPTLINTLVMIGSFTSSEKQAVLEAANVAERVETLVALTDMACQDQPGSGAQRVQ